MPWTDTIVLEKSYTVSASFRYSFYVYVPCDGDANGGTTVTVLAGTVLTCCAVWRVRKGAS